MSPTPNMKAARAQIACSDLLLFDSETLTFVTGTVEQVTVDPSVAKDLMAAGELVVKGASRRGVISLEMTLDAFRRGLATRRGKKGHKLDWPLVLGAMPSGASSAPTGRTEALVPRLVVVPFNASLFGRLVVATQDALEVHSQDMRIAGTTLRFPGYLVPPKSVELRGDVTDLVPLFESVELTIMIDAAQSQYVFGVHAHGKWLGTEASPITDVLEKAKKGLGNRLNRSVIKSADQLVADLLLVDKTSLGRGELEVSTVGVGSEETK